MNPGQRKVAKGYVFLKLNAEAMSIKIELFLVLALTILLSFELFAVGTQQSGTPLAACHHTPNLTIVHHTATAHAELLLGQACRMMGVRSADFSVKLVRYDNGAPFLNAEVCRDEGTIYLGLAIWEAFHDRPEIIVYLLLHELGHSTHGWAGRQPQILTQSPEELDFISQFTRAQRIELASDREAIDAFLREYSGTALREAIFSLARLMGSPKETSPQSGHPGYLDRLKNADYFRPADDMPASWSGRPSGRSIPGRVVPAVYRRNYSSPKADAGHSTLLFRQPTGSLIWNSLLDKESTTAGKWSAKKSQPLNVNGSHPTRPGRKSGEAIRVRHRRPRPPLSKDQHQRHPHHRRLGIPAQKFYRKHRGVFVVKWVRTPSREFPDPKTDSS